MKRQTKFSYESYFKGMGWDQLSIESLSLRAVSCVSEIARLPAYNVSMRMENLRMADGLIKCIADKILSEGGVK